MNTYSFGIHHGVMFTKCALRSKIFPAVSSTIYSGISWGHSKSYRNFNNHLTNLVSWWVICSLFPALVNSPTFWIDFVANSSFTKHPTCNLKDRKITSVYDDGDDDDNDDDYL